MSERQTPADSEREAQEFLSLLSELSYGRSPIDVLTPKRVPSFLSKEEMSHFELILRVQARVFGTSSSRDETFAWVQALTVHPTTLRLLCRRGFLYGSFFMVRTSTGRLEIPEVEHGLHSVRLTTLFPDTLRHDARMPVVAARFLDFYGAFVASCPPSDLAQMTKGRDLLIAAMRNHVHVVPEDKQETFADLLLAPSPLANSDRMLCNKDRADGMLRLIFGEAGDEKEKKFHWLCLVIALGYLTNFLIQQVFATVPAMSPWSIQRFTEGMSDTSWFEKQLNVVINEPGEVAAVLLWDILNGARTEESLYAYGFLDRTTGNWGPAARELSEWLERIGEVFPDEYSDIRAYYFAAATDMDLKTRNLSIDLSRRPPSASDAATRLGRAIGGLRTDIVPGSHRREPRSRFSLSLQKVLRHEFIGDHAHGNNISRGYAFIPLSPTSRQSVSRNRFYWFTAASLNIDFSLLSRPEPGASAQGYIAELRRILDPLTLVVSSLESGVKEPFFRDKLPGYIREVNQEQDDHFTQKDFDYTQHCLLQATEDLADTDRQMSASFLRWYTFGRSSRRHRREVGLHAQQEFSVATSVKEALALFEDYRLVRDGGGYDRLTCTIDSSAVDATVSGCKRCLVIAVVELIRNAAEASVPPYGASDDRAPRVTVTLGRDASCGRMRLSVGNRFGAMRSDLMQLLNFLLAKAVQASRPSDLVPTREKIEAEVKDAIRTDATGNHGGTGIILDVANMVCSCNVESVEYSTTDSGTAFAVVFGKAGFREAIL